MTETVTTGTPTTGTTTTGTPTTGTLTPAAAVLSGAVRVYQWTIRPVIGANCRYEPSCSHYALAVLASHGALRGSVLAARRILRCNPWHEGGYDPPPPAPGAAASSDPATPVAAPQAARTSA